MFASLAPRVTGPLLVQVEAGLINEDDLALTKSLSLVVRKEPLEILQPIRLVLLRIRFHLHPLYSLVGKVRIPLEGLIAAMLTHNYLILSKLFHQSGVGMFKTLAHVGIHLEPVFQEVNHLPGNLPFSSPRFDNQRAVLLDPLHQLIHHFAAYTDASGYFRAIEVGLSEHPHYIQFLKLLLLRLSQNNVVLWFVQPLTLFIFLAYLLNQLSLRP